MPPIYPVFNMKKIIKSQYLLQNKTLNSCPFVLNMVFFIAHFTVWYSNFYMMFSKEPHFMSKD